MILEVKNYKNISSINLELSEEKINFIYGMSGTGKSSIAKALIGDKSKENISYGKKIDDMDLKVQPKINENDFSIFDEQTQKNLLISKNESENIYSILFSNDGSLELIRNDISFILSNINSQRSRLFQYVNNVDEMIKKINTRKLSTSGKFSSNSSMAKLKAETTNPKYGEYSRFIHRNGLDYVKWIEAGANFPLFNEKKCPFCTRKLTEARLNKLQKIMKIAPEQYKIISDSKDILDNIGIEVPNFSSKREVDNLEKKLYDAINNKKIINDMYYMIDSYNFNSLDIKKINKIVFSASLKELYPEISTIIEEFNDNITELKKRLCKIKLKTSKLIGKNIKQLNDYLTKFSIPYQFEVDSYNTQEKKATVFLTSKKDNIHEDRTDNLSYGEKNLIALLLFLVSNNKNITIIDDPASSYDDNRRKIIYDLLFEFHDKQTFVVLSHDQVFIKYSLLGKETKKYLDNTGKILCLENNKGICIAKDICTEDFDSLENQILEFINNNELSYYRKIINLRILSELYRKGNKKDKLIYSYLSAILHNTSKVDVIAQLTQLNMNEEIIIGYIKEKYGFCLEKIPDNVYEDFNYEELTNFEKIAYKREQYRIKREKKRGVKSYIEKEFDDIIHLNTRYFISLNPYKFNIYSENIYDSI